MYYYAIVLLQVICFIHSYKQGTHNKWMWIIIFLPLVGCIAYIYLEIFSKSRYSNVKINLADSINPSRKITKLEDELEVSDSFDNRIKLADAYLDANRLEEAISIYENALTGIFSDNPHVIKNLVIAYYQTERFQDAISFTNKIKNAKEFDSSETHIAYALSLEGVGNITDAQAEFEKMLVRFSNYKHKWVYAEFLLRNDQQEKAIDLLEKMIIESKQLKGFEKKQNRVWFQNANNELKKLYV